MKKRLDAEKTLVTLEMAENITATKVKKVKFKKSRLWIFNKCSFHSSKYGSQAEANTAPLPKDSSLLVYDGAFQCGCRVRFEFLPETVAFEEEVNPPSEASKTPVANSALDELSKKLKYYRHFEIPGRNNTFTLEEAKEKITNVVKALCTDEDFGIFEEGSGEDMQELSGILSNL